MDHQFHRLLKIDLFGVGLTPTNLIRRLQITIPLHDKNIYREEIATALEKGIGKKRMSELAKCADLKNKSAELELRLRYHIWYNPDASIPFLKELGTQVYRLKDLGFKIAVFLQETGHRYFIQATLPATDCPQRFATAVCEGLHNVRLEEEN